MPNLPELFRVFARIGLLSFGGPAAQIALMHRELVEERPWMTEADFLRALSFCMMLPGPEAMQLATYSGWRLRGVTGGLIAGLLFVLPGALVVLLLAMAYAAFGDLPLMAALLRGVQAAVLAIVLHALRKLSKRALKGPVHWALAFAAFIALFVFDLPFPVVVLGAGLIGFFTFNSTAAPRPAAAPRPMLLRQTLSQAAIWAAVWLLPLAALWLFNATFLFEIGLLFSQLAVLTFGGAYAVLAWLSQTIVDGKGWLTLPQMIDALGLAETTPGPLILVTEFVAYLAGHGKGGLPLGLAAAAVALWMTFAPCFLWIFAGAPLIERLEHAPRLSAALAAITAAVVGVIANLSLWFALHVLFATVQTTQIGPARLILPVLSSLDPLAAGLALLATALIFLRHWGLPATLALCAGLGALPALAPIGL
ncbi:chromate efflux transporter [Pseudorhodobacter sp. E13]|uniref:chromate efflux transporter n=1 Tax=Pseudorhodobacter sp. E13 TaxID=2487931 RepID=UPI000F8D5D75|nr:chromate efflux transporter [Pseudorhodobacter sp. E13]RUS59279.1 chromate efflux transporter [Pseudorhodobacter sp. E13]